MSTHQVSLYRYSDVEAKNPRKETIRDAIHHVLTHNDDECYIAMEPYLIAPGKTGSKYFDQAYAVRTLLDYDAKMDISRIANLMEQTPTLRERSLWDELLKVLRRAGFKFQHGRLTGLLEHQPTKDDERSEPGQPDID